MPNPILVTIEHTPKKTFATAADWPGWSRSGKTEELALEALAAYAPRYAVIARAEHRRFAATIGVDDLEIVERTRGSAGTEFGVPSRPTDQDARPLDAEEADASGRSRRGRVGRCSTGPRPRAPEELRKGPRGGGRNTSKVVAHVMDADRAYANEIGIKVQTFEPDDPAAIAAMRDRCSTCSARPATARRSPAAAGRPDTPPIGSPGTPSTTPGRSRTGASPRRRRRRSGVGSQPEPSRLAPHRLGRPAGRTQVADARVAVRLRELRAGRLADQRVVEEPRRLVAAEQPAEPDLAGRVREEVLAADDEVDVLAEVVDDDREPVRPVARPVADDEVAGRRRLAGPVGPTQEVVEGLRARRRAPPAGSWPRRRGAPSSGRPRAAGARPVAPVVAGPRRERRPRAAAAIDEVLRRSAAPAPPSYAARGVGVGLADRTLVRDEPEPGEVLEQRRVERRPRPLPVVVLDPEEHRTRRRAARRPRPRARSRRGRDGGSPSAPGRTASGGRAGRRAPRSDRRRRSASPSVRGGPSRPGRQRSAPARRRSSAATGARAGDRDARATARRRTAACRSPAGRPAASARRSPSRPAAAPRARARRRGPRAGPLATFSRPTSRASSARSFRRRTIRRSSASIRRRSRRSSAVSGGAGPAVAAVARAHRRPRPRRSPRARAR